MKRKATFCLLLLALLAAAPPPPARDIRDKVAADYPNLIPREALDRAFDYLNDHAAQVANKNYLTIIDFTRPSTARRCHVIDLKSGEVESLLVAHARNTGLDRAEHFSNQNGSNKSSL